MASRAFRFRQVDVFTDHLFGGNPLAVFPAAEGLSGDEMQAIAREMNLSETVFVLPTERADSLVRLRIFTPGQELPFAGHPTIGTAWVLAQEGMVPAGQQEITLEEGVGPVAVRLEGDPANPSMLWMRHPPVTFGAPLEDRSILARALGLSADDLSPIYPAVTGSTGLSFLYIPLRDRATVDRAALDPPALRELGSEVAAQVGVFVFAWDPEAGPNRLYSRMFAAPETGVGEDPATGSASGPLGAYLARRADRVRKGLVAFDQDVTFVSEQGTKMGRQSFIHIRLRTTADRRTEEIEVGGSVIPVLEGELQIPD